MERLGIKTNAIYQHYPSDNYYRVIDIVNNCSNEDYDQKFFVVYYRCDKNGIFQSIRKYHDGVEQEIIHQPFCREFNEFIEFIKLIGMTATPRFKFVKQLNT